MSNHTKRRLTGRLLQGCALAALIGAPTAAFAQTAQDETSVDDIVVTGSFATSLADALTVKRRADSITDVVSASDIGN